MGLKSPNLLTRIVILLVVGLGLLNCTVQQEESDLYREAWAYIINSVSDSLVNARNIQFAANGVENVTKTDDNRYQVTSYVDYTDREGESHRTYFFGTVIQEADSWTVESVQLSGK